MTEVLVDDGLTNADAIDEEQSRNDKGSAVFIFMIMYLFIFGRCFVLFDNYCCVWNQNAGMGVGSCCLLLVLVSRLIQNNNVMIINKDGRRWI